MVSVDNFPFEEEEECRDASHPHQTVVRGFFSILLLLLALTFVLLLLLLRIRLSSPGDWIWVVDLGCDRIRHYRKSDSGPKSLFNTHIGQRNTNEGLVHNHDDVANAAPGAGPRHLVLHPSLNVAYLACELQSRVQVKGRLD